MRVDSKNYVRISLLHKLDLCFCQVPPFKTICFWDFNSTLRFGPKTLLIRYTFGISSFGCRVQKFLSFFFWNVGRSLIPLKFNKFHALVSQPMCLSFWTKDMHTNTRQPLEVALIFTICSCMIECVSNNSFILSSPIFTNVSFNPFAWHMNNVAHKKLHVFMLNFYDRNCLLK